MKAATGALGTLGIVEWDCKEMGGSRSRRAALDTAFQNCSPVTSDRMDAKDSAFCGVMELLLDAKRLRNEAERLLAKSEELETEARKCLAELRKSVEREAGSKIVWFDRH